MTMKNIYQYIENGVVKAEGTARYISEKVGFTPRHVRSQYKGVTREIKLVGKKYVPTSYELVEAKKRLKSEQKPYDQLSNEEYYQKVKKCLMEYGNTVVSARFKYVFERLKQDGIKIKETLYKNNKKHYVIERV